MLTNSTIALIIIIVLLIFIMFYSAKYNDNEKFDVAQTTKSVNYNKQQVIEDVASYFGNDMISNYSSKSGSSYKSKIPHDIIIKQLNPNFMNIQFHNDYRDVYTALLNVVPDKRQLFNVANIPINYSEPEVNEVSLMMKDFMAVLNENIKSEVPLYRNPNSGWDEAIVDEQVESGWDKAQKALGLPVSLYEKPAPNGHITLIKVNKIQKYETEDEIRYAIEFVVQKKGVDDQMIIKGSFVQDKRPLKDENNFFINAKVDLKVLIEDLFIVGYLSHDGLKSKQQQLDLDVGKTVYYDLDKMEKNNMTDPKLVQKILMEKYDLKLKEMNLRNGLLDEEGQYFHKTLPNMYDFSNITGTRTIFSDMNEKKVFY